MVFILRHFIECTVEALLGLDGGAKKKKKKAFTTPKKAAHKHKNRKLATLKYYQVDPSSNKVERLKMDCENCGVGVFMAEHKNRYHCGKCGKAYTKQEVAKDTKGKGKKGKKAQE